jgi:tRNA pseudouridine38-40 synthase
MMSARQGTRGPRQRAAGLRSEEAVLRATIEYEGTRFRGWQAQINARTIAGALNEAIRQRLGEGVKLNGAGRTDAGVHAFGQVASIHLPPGVAAGPPERLRRDLNDLLPPDVNVLSLREARPGFHARHDARLRTYRYRFSRRRTAFGKPFVFWVKDSLAADRMAEAVSLLPGRHDFHSFCENAEGHDSTLVEVAFAEVTVPPEAPDLVLFRIGASHFLWKMVRRLAGTLVEIGTGRLPPSEMARLLTERSSRTAPWTAPPSGLFLESIVYPGDPPPVTVPPLRPAF